MADQAFNPNSSCLDQSDMVHSPMVLSGESENSTQAFLDIRQSLLKRLEDAGSNGEVYWDSEGVIDRPVKIDSLLGKVRFIPTFVYRQLLYGQNSEHDCYLCVDGRNNESDIVVASDSERLEEFNGLFIARFNQFPYLEGQMLLASRQHGGEFSQPQYEELFKFMENTGFAGAAMQPDKTSGATVLNHAHISIFDEPLPIFSTDHKVLRKEGDVVIAVSAEHPSICYKVFGGVTLDRAKWTRFIISKLLDKGLSFNLYLDDAASGYIIPRTNRRSSSAAMKVGLSLPGGVYNSYIEHPTTTNIDRLRDDLWDHFQSITSRILAIALQETTVQNVDPVDLLK